MTDVALTNLDKIINTVYYVIFVALV